MRSPLLLVLLAGVTPLLVFALIVTGSGLGWVEWQPPVTWTTQFGAPSGGVYALAADATGVYAAGFLNDSRVFVAKYDLSGKQTWIQQSKVPVSFLASITVGSDGAYVAGRSMEAQLCGSMNSTEARLGQENSGLSDTTLESQ